MQRRYYYYSVWMLSSWSRAIVRESSCCAKQTKKKYCYRTSIYTVLLSQVSAAHLIHDFFFNLSLFPYTTAVCAWVDAIYTYCCWMGNQSALKTIFPMHVHVFRVLLQAVAETLGDERMTPMEVDLAFDWFQKASGVQVRANRTPIYMLNTSQQSGVIDHPPTVAQNLYSLYSLSAPHIHTCTCIWYETLEISYDEKHEKTEFCYFHGECMKTEPQHQQP